MKCIRLLAAVAVLFVVGCDREQMLRGTKGSSGYIEPDYRQVTVLSYEPDLLKETKHGTAKRDAYTVVEDDRKRRYAVAGRAGEPGDTFELDVSLLKEFGQ